MILCDVNVLVHAFRADAPRHVEFRRWMTAVVGGDASYAVSDLALAGFVRVVTHPRVFVTPSAAEDAFAFCAAVRDRPNAVRIAPGPRHWEVFQRLCITAGAKGNLVPDAYFAALAIESGCDWITTDRDFARFEGLRWRHPLA